MNELDEKEEEFQFLSGLETSYSKTTRGTCVEEISEAKARKRKSEKIKVG